MNRDDETATARRPTIAAIASEIGVSAPTISKVLNGRPDVSATTRARVEDALERHRYRRRPAKANDHAPLLDLVFHELESSWSLKIVQGVTRAGAEHGVGVVLSDLEGQHRPRQEWLDGVLARRPLGVLFVMSGPDATQRHQLESRNIPFVVVDTDGEPPPGVPTVGSNNWSGGLTACRHLLSLGHRRIAVISGPRDVLCSRARIDGFRTALEEMQIALDPDLVRFGDFYVRGGYEHGLDLLRRPDRPTAIFAGSDMQALGVLKAAHELGLSVPRDLSIVGYDNLRLTEWVQPSLTTVHQPLHEMADAAARMVLQIAAGQSPPHLRIELATELVVRDSTAPPSS